MIWRVSGKLPPIKLPPGEFAPGRFPPGIFPPMLLNIPTRFFKFFHYCHHYHWYYLKNCFVILSFKSQTYCGVKKNGACRSILLHTQKSFFWSSMIIAHYYIHLFALELFILETEECDVTQFNQINLNSSFSIGLLINWLTCWFIYRSKNNC